MKKLVPPGTGKWDDIVGVGSSPLAGTAGVARLNEGIVNIGWWFVHEYELWQVSMKVSLFY